MTLPNRAGYYVADRRSTQSSNSNSSSQSLSNTVASLPHGSSTGHPPSNHHHHLPSIPSHIPPPVDFSHGVHMDPHQASLFPFLPNHSNLDIMDAHQRIGNYISEPSIDMNVPGIQGPPAGMMMGVPSANNTFSANRFTEIFKSIPENLSQDEINERKMYVKNHRLLPPLMELLTTCKKENILPEPPIPIDPAAPFEDFGLEDFLESQGIDSSPLNADDQLRNPQREEFLVKLEQLKFKYKEEIDKLNKVSTECCSQLIFVLRDQSSVRPVGEHEAQAKLQKIKHKFDYVKNQLRVCVCAAISSLQKQYNQVRKKHKSLPKKATGSLTQWFFDHIQNPYPSEQEKAILAATGGLTMTQVNNWFGNKRIRYKRKCLEGEGRRDSDEGSEPENTQNQSPIQIPPILPSGIQLRKSTRHKKAMKDNLGEEENEDENE